MNWLCTLKKLFRVHGTTLGKQHGAKDRRGLGLENLEERLVPYSVTGNAWPNPQLITISFVPDGTLVSTNGTQQVGSNLFAAFNGNPRLAGQWQTQILKAAQAWSQQTNINFAIVGDSGAASGAGSTQQGDAAMGDIRISGFNFGNSSLGRSMMPPPVNNYSIAGDIAFNTSQVFNVNSTYDLYTVAVHEFGHALGLDHSSSGTSSVMYPSYTGLKPGLSTDDIAGIRNIYSANLARAQDSYDLAASNGTFATASNLNSLVDPVALTASAPNLDVTTTTDVDFYTVTAPTGSSNLNVTVQSAGLSLLSPKVTIYAADQATVLGTASGLGQYGATLNVSLTNVSVGQQFYVKVQGADSSVFGTGRYALALSFGNTPPSVVAPAKTTVASGAVLQGGGGIADGQAAGDDLLNSVPTITGISPDTGSSSNDGVTNANKLKISGTAPTGSVQVYQMATVGGTLTQDKLLGTAKADGHGNWTFDYTKTTLADGYYVLYATAVDAQGVVSNPSTTFNILVDTKAPPTPVIAGLGTMGTLATVSGSAEPYSSVQVLLQGKLQATVPATSTGAWTYTTDAANLGDGKYSFTSVSIDRTGNTSANSAPLTITLTNADGSAALVITQTSQGTTGTLSFSGTAVAGTVITVKDGNTVLGTTVVDANGNWKFTAAGLVKGKHAISVFDTSLAGNVSQLSDPLTINI